MSKSTGGVEMVCHRCEHDWTYSGSKEPGWPVNCPRCGTTVSIPKDD